jgi:peptide/nickel transport system substrate-binding protein
VQFHKGFGELMAEDMKSSSERQRQRTKGMLFAQNLDVIKELTVVDPYTVQITLKAYDPVFLLRMVGYQHGYIVSKKAAEQFGDLFGWNLVGTGPFYSGLAIMLAVLAFNLMGDASRALLDPRLRGE